MKYRILKYLTACLFSTTASAELWINPIANNEDVPLGLGAAYLTSTTNYKSGDVKNDISRSGASGFIILGNSESISLYVGGAHFESTKLNNAFEKEWRGANIL